MKKVFSSIILTIILALIVCSCSTEKGEEETKKVEVVDFDVKTAEHMLEKGEKIIADISIKGTVSRQDYNQFLSVIDEIYGEGDEPWNYMFFNNEEFENEQVETLHLNKEMFFPTIYHKGIIVTSAQVENTYYDDESHNTSILIIREEYTGNDQQFDDWYREHYYQRDANGDWEFHGFGGQINFLGDGFKPDYLELKEDI
ncbi:MAG: hypothetical protein K0R19_2534 [Bacillota bacterium]|jgi:hypothetical protein|nr:hypothetical protein [Bacillota bacterium]